MRRAIFMGAMSALLAGGAMAASVWGPGILIDGSFDDWDGQVPILVSDPSGDGGTGRDVQAIYLANDQNNLYVRIQSFNSDGYDGNEFSGIDGDNSLATGFGLFAGDIGSDTLVAGVSVYAETTGSFNAGAASPSAVAWSENAGQTDVEYAIQLNTTIPGDILQSFPGGLGSTIAFKYGDGNGGAGDVAGPTAYTLASNPGLTPFPTIDDMVLYDTNANASFRTRDVSTAGGFSATRANFAAGGPGGALDTALQVTHTNAASSAFNASLVAHRFAVPRNITGHTTITLDVFGDPALNPANQNLFVGLKDTGATYYAIGLGAPSTASWQTIDLGPTSGWFLQAAGDDGVLDLANIAEWVIGIQENGNAVGSTSTVGYDNFLAPGAVPVSLSVFSAD
jgi:hypothetical protein